MSKSAVTSRTVKRFYIYGRGHNSELSAYMQMAKRLIDSEYWQSRRRDNPPFPDDNQYFIAWWSNRYPKREGCNCLFCRSLKPTASMRGCFITRMADIRAHARMLMVEISIGLRTPEGNTKPKALPQRSVNAD